MDKNSELITLEDVEQINKWASVSSDDTRCEITDSDVYRRLNECDDMVFVWREDFSKKGMLLLAKIIVKCKNISYLDVRNCNMSTAFALYFAQEIAKSESISHLYMEGNNLDKDNFLVEQFVKQIKGMSGLKYLCGVNNDCIRRNDKALYDNIQKIEKESRERGKKCSEEDQAADALKHPDDDAMPLAAKDVPLAGGVDFELDPYEVKYGGVDLVDG